LDPVKSNSMKRIVWLLLAFLLYSGLWAQNKIELIHANTLRTLADYGPDYQFLKGQVILSHDSSTIFCDSAVYNLKQNSFRAYNRVRLVTIKGNDTVLMSCDSIFYLGDSSYAFAYGHIRLEKDSITLLTDTLEYDFNSDQARYLGGGRIISNNDTLISLLGIYNTRERKAYFKDSVRIFSKKYRIFSDTLVHDFASEQSIFLGPTYIYTDSNTIFCNKGVFDHKKNRAIITEGASLQLKKQTITAQTITYDRNQNKGWAIGQVKIIDTVDKYILMGEYGEFYQKSERFYLIGDATLIQYDNDDTLWLRSDTIFSFKDTLRQDQDTFIFRKAVAYHHVKAFHRNLQMACDSLIYSFLDSTIFLYGNPILWTDSIQLYGQTAELTTVRGEPFQLILDGGVFMAEHTLDDEFNQIFGQKVIIFFKKRQINRVEVYSQAQAIYFIFEDSTLIAINNLQCDTIKIYIKDKKVRGLTAIGKPSGKILPPDQATEQERRLPGFRWFAEYRPLKPSDIYIWKRE